MTTTETAKPDYFDQTARAIVRCTPCKAVRRVEFTTRVRIYVLDGRPMYRNYVLREDGYEAAYRDRYDLPRSVLGSRQCEGCGEWNRFTFKVVQGYFRESVACGAKCRNAIGPSCECQCSGENHGMGHGSL
jgi:hypothetical protein